MIEPIGQPGEIQDTLRVPRDVSELDRDASGASVAGDCDQHTKAGGIDEAERFEIEHERAG